jgi:addiction module HigA family antidote
MKPADPWADTAGADHPGLLLRRDVLPALKLSVSQTARELGIARQTLHRIMAGVAPITPETAVRLERLCGVPSGFWLERQQRHELPRVREEIAKDLARIPSRPLPREVLVHIGASDEV